MWWAFARRVARVSHVHFTKQLLWALRCELGERTNRLHFHALLGGLPDHLATRGGCEFLCSIWGRVHGGHACARPFNPAADLVGYCACDLDQEGADIYEASKFSLVSSPVLLSRTTQTAAESYLRRSGGVQRRHKRLKGEQGREVQGPCVWQGRSPQKMVPGGADQLNPTALVDGCGARAPVGIVATGTTPGRPQAFIGQHPGTMTGRA